MYNVDNSIDSNVNDLDELVIDDEGTSSSLPPIRLELDGVTTEEEIHFIKGKSVDDSDNPVKLFVIFGLDVLPVCTVDLNIDLLLSLKYIGLNSYTLTLVNGERKLDLLKPNMSEMDVEMILNFIRIGGFK